MFKHFPLNGPQILSLALNIPTEDLLISPGRHFTYSGMVRWLNDNGWPTRSFRPYTQSSILKRKARAVWPVVTSSDHLATLYARRYSFILYRNNTCLSEPYFPPSQADFQLVIYPPRLP